MKISLFKSTVARIVEPELQPLGYEMDFDPLEDFEGDIHFDKTLQDGIYITIHFQPSELGSDHVVDFAVNLTRNWYTNKISKEQMLSGYRLHCRLAAFLWIQDRFDPEWEGDHWWHFLTEQDLEAACRNVLEKLFHYGIPWAEDLDSSNPFPV